MMKAPPRKHEDTMLQTDFGELQMDRMRLQNPGCDPHEIARRASMAGSMASSAHSGPSLESSRYSVDTEGLSQMTPVASKDGEKKKKKKKDSKEKELKLDEHGNPIKKKKSKRKEKEGSTLEQSPVAPHKEPLSDRLRASDDSFQSEVDMDEPHFDDFFVKRNQEKHDPRAPVEIDNWDAFALPTKNPPRHDDYHDDGLKSHQSKSQNKLGYAPTEHTARTAITMSSAESYPPPPVTSIDVTGYEDDISTVGGGMHEYHGEMLHTFLQRSGQNDQLALQTAMAFESFLKQQQESLVLLHGTAEDETSLKSGSNSLPDSKQSSHGESTRNDEDSFDRHLEKMEKMIEQRGDGDSFALGESWDAGTFASYNDPMLSRGPERSKEYTHPLQDDGWSNIRRNETYLRRMSGDDTESQRPSVEGINGSQSTPRTRNMVAATQRNMIGAQSYPRNHVQGGLKHPPSVGPPRQMGPPHMMGPPRQMGPPHMMGPPHRIAQPQNYAGAQPLVGRPSGPPRPFDQQMSALSIEQRTCVMQLKKKWETRGQGTATPFPDLWYMRFAKCSPGRPFSAKSAWIVMKKFDQRYLGLSILGMESQLLTKTLFPCPGLKSSVGYDMFYMRPARYFPKETSVATVIDNLVYVMECMLDDERACTDGIGFVANMTGWQMTNFTVSYCLKFMMSLQGRRVPARVGLFLIVNPPAWFGSVWKIMKPMLSEDFRKKVHMIKLERMAEFLAPGFERFLPDDVQGGRAPTDAIIRSFVAERKAIESARLMAPR